MSHDQDHLLARVEAEEFAGGPMTPPPAGTLTLTKSGRVLVTNRAEGSWRADCTMCGASCGAAGAIDGVDLDTDVLDEEHRRLEVFTEEHRSCCEPIDQVRVLPSPTSMPSSAPCKPTVWIVKGSNGADLRVLAERHSTFPRAEGAELRFHNGDGDTHHRVATVRPGSWHWVTAESALNPPPGER